MQFYSLCYEQSNIIILNIQVFIFFRSKGDKCKCSSTFNFLRGREGKGAVPTNLATLHAKYVIHIPPFKIFYAVNRAKQNYVNKKKVYKNYRKSTITNGKNR